MTQRQEPGMSQELRLLLDAVAQRAEPWLRKISEGPLAGPGDNAGEQSSSHAEHRRNCSWCPVCAAISLARGERPELAAKAAEHITGLLTVLRASMEPERPAGADAGTEAGEKTERNESTAAEPERPEPAPRVQKISVERT